MGKNFLFSYLFVLLLFSVKGSTLKDPVVPQISEFGTYDESSQKEASISLENSGDSKVLLKPTNAEATLTKANFPENGGLSGKSSGTKTERIFNGGEESESTESQSVQNNGVKIIEHSKEQSDQENGNEHNSGQENRNLKWVLGKIKKNWEDLKHSGEIQSNNIFKKSTQNSSFVGPIKNEDHSNSVPNLSKLNAESSVMNKMKSEHANMNIEETPVENELPIHHRGSKAINEGKKNSDEGSQTRNNIKASISEANELNTDKYKENGNVVKQYGNKRMKAMINAMYENFDSEEGPSPADYLAQRPESHTHVLRILTYISSILSICGACTIIWLYYKYLKLRSFTVKLLLYLSLADLFSALSHFVQDTDNYSLCHIQAYMQHFFFLSSFLWILCIAVDQYLRVIKKEVATFRNEIFYHITCWGIPLALVIFLAFTHAYGATDLWCWIKPQYKFTRWISFYLPLVVILMSVILLNWIAVDELKRNRKMRMKSFATGRVEIEMYAYLVAFVLIRTPSVIHRIHELSNFEMPYTLEILHAIGSPMQGFCNCILFLSNPVVRHFLKYGGFGKKKHEDEKEEVNSLLPESEEKSDDHYLQPFPDNFGKDDIIQVFTGIWNMGNESPPSQGSLSAWIPSSGYDIYAIGVQECHYKATSENSKWLKTVKTKEEEEHVDEYQSWHLQSLTCEHHWFGMLGDFLGDGFDVVGAQSMGTIRLIVFARRSLFPNISQVHVGKEGTGVGNVGVNKGAVGVSFRIGSMSLCFVNSHLAAHEDHIEDRNKDVVQIVRRLKLGSSDLISQFHALFFMGDLNYRVTLPSSEIIQNIEKENWEPLQECDELTRLRVSKRMFYGFNEGSLYFKPSFKYLIGSHNYNLKRNPSWTDRIMWRLRKGVRIQQTFYGDVQAITSSDHKPVKAMFRIGYPHLFYIPTVFHREKNLLSFVSDKALPKENNESGLFSVFSNISNAGVSKPGPGKAEEDFENKQQEEIGASYEHEQQPFIQRTESMDFDGKIEKKEGEDEAPHWRVLLTSITLVDCSGPQGLPLSEPYIVFKSEFLENEKEESMTLENFDNARVTSGKVESKMLFEWSSEDLPQICAPCNKWKKQDLETSCLILEIKDNSLHGDDDMCGKCCIDLRDAFDSPVSFENPVLLDTAFNGYLMGCVKVEKVDPKFLES